MARQELNTELVDNIENSLSGTSAVAPEGDGVFYAELEKATGHGQETADKIADFIPVYASASVAAVGKKGLKNMMADKSLESVTGEVPMGRFGTAGGVIHRSKEISIPPAEKGGEATKEIRHGHMLPKVELVAGRSGGLMNKAKEAVKAASDEYFKKK